MIRYRQVDKTFFPLYDRIPMRVQVTAQYKVEKLRRGLGGFVLVETPVKGFHGRRGRKGGTVGKTV